MLHRRQDSTCRERWLDCRPMEQPTEPQTDSLRLAQVLEQTIHLVTHCVLALNDASLMDEQRSTQTARTLRMLAKLLDDPEAAVQPGLALALHEIAHTIGARPQGTPGPPD